jgi:hypothetical protein
LRREIGALGTLAGFEGGENASRVYHRRNIRMILRIRVYYDERKARWLSRYSHVYVYVNSDIQNLVLS